MAAGMSAMNRYLMLDKPRPELPIMRSEGVSSLIENNNSFPMRGVCQVTPLPN
jgi:hypothetical protein